MQRAADDERSMQLTLRSIANGIISERDRLFQYTVGELFQELSLFIHENELKNKAMEEAFKK